MDRGAILQAAWAMVALIGVLALAVFTVRLLGGRLKVVGRIRSLRVQEHLALGRDGGLWLVEAEGRHLLLATGARGATLLADLSGEGGVAAGSAAAAVRTALGTRAAPAARAGPPAPAVPGGRGVPAALGVPIAAPGTAAAGGRVGSPGRTARPTQGFATTLEANLLRLRRLGGEGGEEE